MTEKRITKPLRTSIDYFNIHKETPLGWANCKSEFGAVGVGVIVSLLGDIYNGEHGFYSAWTDRKFRFFAKELYVDLAQLKSIIEGLIEDDFFDKKLYQKHTILTSKDIQKFWFGVTRLRTTCKVEFKFWIYGNDSLKRKNIFLLKNGESMQKTDSSEKSKDSSVESKDNNNNCIQRKGKERKGKEITLERSKSTPKNFSFSEEEGTISVYRNGKKKTKSPSPKKEKQNEIFLTPNVGNIENKFIEVNRAFEFGLSRETIAEQATLLIAFYSNLNWNYPKSGNRIKDWESVAKAWLVNGIKNDMIKESVQSPVINNAPLNINFISSKGIS